jgi:hypothetical protein
MAAETTGDAEQVIAHIREINEQVIEVGRKAGLDFLRAYEQTLNTVADYQDKLADKSQVDQLANPMRAQASFTWEVVGAYAEVASGALRR